MTIESWLEAAINDSNRRGLPELKPILETLARATNALRAADFNDHASGRPQPAIRNPQSAIHNPQSDGPQSDGPQSDGPRP